MKVFYKKYLQHFTKLMQGEIFWTICHFKFYFLDIRVGPDIRCGRISGHFQYPAGYRILKLSGRISGNIIFYILQQKSLFFLILDGCNFLIIEDRRTIFSEYVYLYVNFILEISKHKFWRWQQYLAAACRKPTVGR